MCEGRSIFVLEEAYYKKKKLFSELEEKKKNGNFWVPTEKVCITL